MCNFCEKIVDYATAHQSMKHYECGLLKDSASNVGFGICIDGEIYIAAIDFCPYCGRKLAEEENV